MRYPRNPLDVLAQHIVAACAVDEWSVDDLYALVRRCASFAELSEDAFRETLDLLAGRYPSDRFSGLRPRIVWDRVQGRVRAREGAQRVAVQSGGTIPDRGLFGVFLPDGVRVGELDEEMVYESRVGECFVLGASTWRIEEITVDRVVVTPAPGEPAKTPFWRGDRPGRPLELGRALGKMSRELRELPGDQAEARLHASGLDARAASNLRQYLAEQGEATGAVPDDRTVVIERFPDEIGDWRVCILTPFGSRVHAPWALAIEERLERNDLPVQVLWSDDGIILRLPESIDDVATELLLPEPDELDDLVISRLPSTSLFASKFRENAARALLLPRRRPGERTPLWQQRQRAADLLEVASGYPSFPMLLETTRECVRDIFDVPALREVLGDIRSRKVRVVPVETRRASPFAQSLLFGWIAAYMYEGDAPLAERRAAALALDRDLLRDLMGAEELRELLDPEVLAELELELQRLVPARQARNADDLHDLLADLGPLTIDELRARCATVDPQAWLDAVLAERRVIEIAGHLRSRRRRGPVARRARMGHSARTAGGVHRARGASTRRSRRPVCAHARAVHHRRRTHPARGVGRARARRTHSPRGRRASTARRIPARAASSESGATPACCARCAAVRSRRCATRSSPSMRQRLRGSCRRGRASAAGDADSTRSSKRSSSCRASRYRRRCWSATCCPPGSTDTGRRCSTSSARPARSFGSAPDHSATTTAACACSSATASGSCLRAQLPATVLTASSTTRFVIACCARAQVSGPISCRPRGPPTTRWCSRRCGISCGPVKSPTTRSVRCACRDGRRRGGRRAAAGRIRVASPGSGRPRVPAGGRSWRPCSSPSRRRPRSRPTQTHLQILERHGVVTREGVRSEGVPGGFAGVYPVLRALEEAGRARRGWFVAGLGAAQFALPGAVDRLRAHRNVDDDDPARVLVLAATDPGQPYGAALAWPEHALPSSRPARASGAFVVLVDGACAAYVERGGKSLLTFPGVDGERWPEALVEAHKEGRLPRLTIERIDDEPARTSPHAGALRAAGFADGYKGLTLRD